MNHNISKSEKMQTKDVKVFKEKHLYMLKVNLA